MTKFRDRQDNCPICDGSMQNRRPQARYCSLSCKRKGETEMERERRAQRRAYDAVEFECINPICGNTFKRSPNPADRKRLTCNRTCGIIAAAARVAHKNGLDPRGAAESWAINHGMLIATRVYFRTCRCGAAVCTKTRGVVEPNCGECSRKALQAIDARKNQKRRTSGPPSLSVHEIAERDGATCRICREPVDMTLDGMAQHGPTVEHIVPVSLGGTNDHDNLALAHRSCNTRRGNRPYSQVLISA